MEGKTERCWKGAHSGTQHVGACWELAGWGKEDRAKGQPEIFAFSIFGLIDELFQGKDPLFYFCPILQHMTLFLCPPFPNPILLLSHNLDTVKFTDLKANFDELLHVYIAV